MDINISLYEYAICNPEDYGGLEKPVGGPFLASYGN
jgi:hypothetical protein